MKTFLEYLAEQKDGEGLTPDDHQHIYHLAVEMNRRHASQYGKNNPTDTPENFQGVGGLDKDFGWSATMGSAKAAYKAMKSGKFGRDDLAQEIHKGWSHTAQTHPNQTPEQRERRGKLVAQGQKDWHGFSDEEKLKDLELADAAHKYWRDNINSNIPGSTVRLVSLGK